jgi:hypothetical protein
MKLTRLPPAVLAGVLASGLATAAPVVVKVEDMGFTTNSNVIQQVLPGFGSTGPVTLNWDPLNNFNTRLLNWQGSYSGRDAAWCSFGTNCQLDLNVTSGNTVTLESFFLGGWPNATRTIAWSVIDLADNSVVASNPGASVSGTTGLVVAVNATSSTGFAIKFGPDGFNGGINDITYSFASDNGGGGGGTPVPAPGALALFGTALLGFGLAVRRRRG